MLQSETRLRCSKAICTRTVVIMLALAALPATAADYSVQPDKPNVVTFPVQEAKLVRFAIAASSKGQPCIDELEVYGPDSKDNLALASKGAKASASSCLPGHAIHQIPHLNDGKYGNDHSWIAKGCTNEWAQIKLPKPMRIDRVVFSRDRKRHYRDRVPIAFEVQLSKDGQQWQTVKKVGSGHLVVQETMLLLPNKAVVLDFPKQKAKFVRLAIGEVGTGSQPCVDELEVFADDLKQNLALASAGGKASASSCLEGHAIHKIPHLNDGKYTNAHSWIAGDTKGEWAQVELSEAAAVKRVVFSRDRGGNYRDRMPTSIELQLSMDGREWNTVKKVKAIEDVPIDKRLAQESPEDWAWRITMDISGNLRKVANELAAKVETDEDVRPLLELYELDRERKAMAKRFTGGFNIAALRRAVADMVTSFPERYRPPGDLNEKLKESEAQLPQLVKMLNEGDATQIREAMTQCEDLFAFQRTALLANPLLDFDEILLLKRKTPAKNQKHPYWKWGQKYGMTVNWSCDFRPKNPPVAPWWEDEIVSLSLHRDEEPIRTVYKPKPGHMIQHPELHFDADRLLFAMPGPQGAFQIFEANIDGTGLRQITTDTGPDVDNGDPCYLPDGRIVFNSTRGFQAVPCEDGNSYVANLCVCNADGSNTRMLTFDQESNWYPTLLNNGRVLYTRYEYANISHQFGRLLFHMNPDGTGQMEYYGSNSYWPNSIFYARPIPSHPTLVIGTVCGHHGPNRTGPLVLFDPARGRRETAGAVQMIPGFGKPVERVCADVLYGGNWPKFVHPYPLNDKYFLASARLHPGQVEYALYLVDVFDNITEICRLPDYSLLEPIPLKKHGKPPVIPDRTVPNSKEATMSLSDVYEGAGMAGVPRGTVKRLRLFTYNYVYRHTSRRGFGHLATPGVDGPWEPRYILGTVPVKADGSALFTVPANTPISVQPLDARGRAVQQMRSWFTAMPGETLSCVGCHEPQNASPPAVPTGVPVGRPCQIEPWRGPPRGFDFELEVQPVLDKHCVGCHNGTPRGRADFSRKPEDEKLRINQEYHRATESAIKTILTPSFIALHPYVRRAHAESNYGLQVAAEFSVDTSPLVQMLEQGHHNVRLDDEAWDRLYTWIDLGAPDHGSWKNSEWGAPNNYYERRLEMFAQFANRTDDIEWMPSSPEEPPAFVKPDPNPQSPIRNPQSRSWSFSAEEAKRRQTAVGLPKTLSLDVADGLKIELMLIPPGESPMGDIDSPFYMGRCEVTNAQFAALADREHNSGHVSWFSIDWRGEGYPLFRPDQPVVRVSWHQAREFCGALSAKTGKQVGLPTEAQWEWACRAGSATAMWYGGLDDDFSKSENLAGRELRGLAFRGKRKWYLRDDRFDDGQMVTAKVGSYRPNPWGLHDMHGNVCEWTRSAQAGEKVTRGGSWYDKPNRATSAFRWRYPAWRKVHNVGFRVIVAVD